MATRAKAVFQGLVAHAWRGLGGIIPSPARSLVRFGRRWRDKILHPLRRLGAKNRIRRLDGLRSVLFVCHGNICRSPFAAALLRQALTSELGGNVRISSAGFIGPGRPTPVEGIAVAKRRGVDLTKHRSRLVTPEVTSSADLIVVMNPGQRRALTRQFGLAKESILVLGDLDPKSACGREIVDPVDRPEVVFDRSYGRIERCVRELAAHLTCRLSLL